MFPTSTKPVEHHVQELARVPLRLPMAAPCTRTPSPARICRCSADRPTVEHPACTHCTATTPAGTHPPEARPTTSTRPRHPSTPLARARTEPPRLDAQGRGTHHNLIGGSQQSLRSSQSSEGPQPLRVPMNNKSSKPPLTNQGENQIGLVEV